MKRKLLPLAAIAMLFAACSSDEPNLLPEEENIPQVANPYRVSLDDALDNAETLLSQISEAETRSGRRVASVKYFTTPSTRSADSDTMLYLVNYENDGGFALLSADSRLRPVYAISDEGSLNMEDTVYNKGLAMFARGVEAEIASLPLNPILPPVDPIVPPTDTLRIQRKVGPLLNSYVRNWSQDAPYNRYCFMTDGRQAIVGCTAVAVGQIMAYHEWPLDYDGYYYEWDAMKNGQDDDMVAHFLRSLGNPENLNMRYGNYGEANGNGSSAFVSRYNPTFANMGYICNNLTIFSEENIQQMLSGTYSSECPASPVLISSNHVDGGHGWVIDGWLLYINQYTTGTHVQYVYEDYLYHCVWGWGGKNNGYYYLYNSDDVSNAFTDDGLIEKDEDDIVDEIWPFGTYFNSYYIGGIIPVRAVPAD